jgi:steroid 5-alpha reductase family enzyme
MIRTVLMFVAVAALAILMAVLIAWSISTQPPVQRIDCTWSEISPDFSPAMREACRKARSK